MSKSLFIAEKPSVAMEFAKALRMSAKRKNGYLEDEQNIVTWCRGHLIEMCYPEEYNPELKKWKAEDLPFLPDSYKYKVIEASQDQYKIVAALLNRSDISKIYYSGDSAREGEYIQRLVRMMAGKNPSAKEYRVWIDSQTDEEIIRGIRGAKPLSDYDSLSDSAYARAIEDYLIGMNFSRILSVKYAGIASNASGGKYHAIAVGRVMSCVLGMIVERERLIRNTKQVSFYGIQSNIGNLTMSWKITEQSQYYHSPDNYNNNGLLNPAPVKELVFRMNAAGILQILSNQETITKKQAPLLFNLAELQSECTKLFKISPSETLSIAQSLYEKKLTTYPRTDARVLTTAITKVYHGNISGLKSFPEIAVYAEHILVNHLHDPNHMDHTKYVNNELVSDHYAIIPTGQGAAEYGSLPDLEKKVYLLIARRFLSIFYPAAEYKKRNITGKACEEIFASSCSILTSPGYLEVVGYEEKANEKMLFLEASKISGTVQATFQVHEGKSKPPSRYTTGSIILAMENAGNLIENPELREQIKGSGIGTSATRAETIAKLERIQYIKIDKKTQTIIPDMFGEIVYDILKEALPQILNPQYTASWEKGLQGIVDKKVTKDYYLSKIYAYVRDGIIYMKNQDYTEQIHNAIQGLQGIYPSVQNTKENKEELVCPICGKPIRMGDKNYYCTGYREGCKFSIWKTISGKTIPETVIKGFIKTWSIGTDGLGCSGKSKKITGFTSKTGKKFDACLQLVSNPDGSLKTIFQFDQLPKR